MNALRHEDDWTTDTTSLDQFDSYYENWFDSQAVDQPANDNFVPIQSQSVAEVMSLIQEVIFRQTLSFDSTRFTSVLKDAEVLLENLTGPMKKAFTPPIVVLEDDCEVTLFWDMGRFILDLGIDGSGMCNFAARKNGKPLRNEGQWSVSRPLPLEIVDPVRFD